MGKFKGKMGGSGFTSIGWDLVCGNWWFMSFILRITITCVSVSELMVYSYKKIFIATG